MLSYRDFNASQIELLGRISPQLCDLPGVEAIVLGGSHARGTARLDSDLDIAIYYSEQSPPDIQAIRRCVEGFAISGSPPVVTDFYGWGPWVNGGAWVQTFAGKLDLLYRNMDQLQRVLDESQEGIYHHDFYQQPTFGFVSVIYLAETKSCLPITDPRGLLSEFKRQVEVYPARLRKKLIGDLLWTAEFTFLHADGFAERIDVFNTVGCLARVAFMLAQALFALNEEYYFGDKGSLQAIDLFSRKPELFSQRLQAVLALPMPSPRDLQYAVHRMHVLWQEVVALTEGQYVPKFKPPTKSH